MSDPQSLRVPWPNHSGSPPQMATDEPAKQRMPWETEPGTAKGQSLDFEHVSRKGVSWMSANLWQQECQVFWLMLGGACGLRFCSSSSQSRTRKTEDALGNGAWNSKGSEP